MMERTKQNILDTNALDICRL